MNESLIRNRCRWFRIRNRNIQPEVELQQNGACVIKIPPEMIRAGLLATAERL